MEFNGKPTAGFSHGKTQELLAILLLNRGRPRRRDWIANELWDDPSCRTPRKNLRHVLWKLQDALANVDDSLAQMIQCEGSDWIHCRPPENLWFDVNVFEQAHARPARQPAERLSGDQARNLEEAIDLYTGQLLDGCDQHWCLIERERLRDCYTTMLDALIDHCIVSDGFDRGINLAHRNLREDYAREQTHQRLMVLSALAGDRTTALRQFGRCATALKREFNIEPGRATVNLRDLLLDDRLGRHLPVVDRGIAGLSNRAMTGGCADMLVELRGLLCEVIEAVESEPRGAVRT